VFWVRVRVGVRNCKRVKKIVCDMILDCCWWFVGGGFGLVVRGRPVEVDVSVGWVFVCCLWW
jgi:hypothetical protein